MRRFGPFPGKFGAVARIARGYGTLPGFRRVGFAAFREDSVLAADCLDDSMTPPLRRDVDTG